MDLASIAAVLAAIHLLAIGLVGLFMTYIALLKPSLPGLLIVAAFDAYTLGLGGALLMYAWSPVPGRGVWLAVAYAPAAAWFAFTSITESRHRLVGRALAREFLSAPEDGGPAARERLLELVKSEKLVERRGAATLLWRALSRVRADEERIAILTVLGPLEGESRRRRRTLVDLLADTEAGSPLRTAVREALLHVGAQGLRYGANDELPYHRAYEAELELREAIRHRAISTIDTRISELAPHYDHLALWDTPASALNSAGGKRRQTSTTDERYDRYLSYRTAARGRESSPNMELNVSDHEHRPRSGTRLFSFPLARGLLAGHVHTAEPSNPDLERVVVAVIEAAVLEAEAEYRQRTPFSDAEAAHAGLAQRVAMLDVGRATRPSV